MTSRPKRHRPALIVFVVVAAAACLALGWWQWTRFEAVGGTGQNLGYALQWPLFAVFVVYAYRRFVQLEDDRTDPEAPEVGATPESATRAKAEPTEIPPDLLPHRPTAKATDGLDERTSEYNRYLAELNARDRNDRSTT
ncbi:transcriptional regulator [Aldersonia kunmingensis]|uniref:transcriptional regulator n=1 Tax=Aldersonia kunmingensis TaxID=408066 RepID=UPI0008361986|nr:transcriptional regulator [Aldersonia kunmingensis]